jgi:hypothetical protein
MSKMEKSRHLPNRSSPRPDPRPLIELVQNTRPIPILENLTRDADAGFDIAGSIAPLAKILDENVPIARQADDIGHFQLRDVLNMMSFRLCMAISLPYGYDMSQAEDFLGWFAF